MRIFFAVALTLFSFNQKINASDDQDKKVLIMGAHPDQWKMSNSSSRRSELLQMKNVFFLDNFSRGHMDEELYWLRERDPNFNIDEHIQQYDKKYHSVQNAVEKGESVPSSSIPINTYAFDFKHLKKFREDLKREGDISSKDQRFDSIIFDDSVFKFFPLESLQELQGILKDDGAIFIPLDSMGPIGGPTLSKEQIKYLVEKNNLASIIFGSSSVQDKEDQIIYEYNKFKEYFDEEANDFAQKTVVSIESAMRQWRKERRAEASSNQSQDVGLFDGRVTPRLVLAGVLTPRCTQMLEPYFENARNNRIRKHLEAAGFRQNNINLGCIDNDVVFSMNNATVEVLKKNQRLREKEYIVLLKKENRGRFPIAERCLY